MTVQHLYLCFANISCIFSYSVTPNDDDEDSVPIDLDLDNDTGHHSDSELDLEDDIGLSGESTQPMYILPLYSLLASDKQKKV